MTTETLFSRRLQFGKVAESLLAKWLIRRGFSVLPIYELAEKKYKGPQIFSGEGSFIAPDLMAIQPGKILLVEAKHKSGFTWSRRHHRFETGIDLKHYMDYQRVREITSIPLWIMFLQNGQAVKDAPANKPTSPKGLFGNEIHILRERESHRDHRWGKHGMVYWAADFPPSNPALRLIADYEEIVNAP